MQCSECVNPVSLGRIAASLLALLRMLPLRAHADTRARVRHAVWPGWAYVVWRGGMLMLHAVAYDTRTERRSNRFAHFLRHTALLGTRGQSTHWTAWSSSVPTTPECATGGRTCCRALHRRALQSAQSRRVLRAAYSVAACCKLACCMLRAAKCALPVIRGMLHAAVCSSFSTLHAALAHWHYQYGE